MNNNNKNMNPTNKNQTNNMSTTSGTGLNPTIINNYYYNQNRNRNNNNRNRNRNNNNNQNKKQQKILPSNLNKNDQSNNNQHIIIRSTQNPENMRIIPISQSMSPFAIHSSILKSFMEKNNKLLGNGNESEIKPEVKKVEEIEKDLLKEIEFVELKDINNLDDLIKVGEEFDIKDKRRYSIDMNRLKNIIKPFFCNVL